MAITYTKAKLDQLLVPGRGGSRVALLGDSITDFNGNYTAYPTSVETLSRGYFAWANVYLRHRLTVVTPSTTDFAWGASGMTAATMLSNGDALGAATSAADIMIVLAGTNDLTDAANYTAQQIANNLLSIWNLGLANGKRVVAGTIWPRNNSDTPQVTQKLKDTNRLIRKYVRQTPGVTLCDWYGTTVDPSTNLAASSTYYIDGVHPNPTGASRMGWVLAQVLDQLVPSYGEEIALDAGDTANYVANGALMMGTTGYNSATSGQVADNWNLYTGVASATVPSKVARTDIWPGMWQQIVQTSANFALQTYGSIGGTNQPAIGDLIYGNIEFETDAANWNATQLNLELTFNGSSNVSRELTFAEQKPFWRPPTGILQTPVIPVPTGATLWKLTVNMYGAGTIRLGRSEVTKVV
jgi:lysophospholipase L1-like esterase